MATSPGTSLLDQLLNLFRVDAQVRGLRSRLDSAQRYLTHQEKQLRELSQQLDEAHSRKRQAQAKIGNLEGEVAVIDQRIEKYRNDLNSAVTNKQYTAVLTELNTVKLSRNSIEERTLEEMGRLERLDQEIAGLQTQIQERTKVRDVARAQLNERQSEVGQRLSELEAERNAAASEIPPTELDLFNELSLTYEGEAMAPVEEIDRRSREYSCGSCNMELPFEAVSLLAGVSNALVRCSACGRILYMQDETRGTLSRK